MYAFIDRTPQSRNHQHQQTLTKMEKKTYDSICTHRLSKELIEYSSELQKSLLESYNFQDRIDRFQTTQTKPDPLCIHTLPDVLIAESTEQPIRIPNSFDLPDKVIACIYHRYATSLQTRCVEPRLVGPPDNRTGFICVDNNRMGSGNCKAAVFDSSRHDSYIRQLKEQYHCEVEIPLRSQANDLCSSLGNWMSRQEDLTSEINLLVLKVEMNQKDMYILNELLINTQIMSKVTQIDLRIYLDPRKAVAMDYIERLLIFRKLYNLGFRIFFHTRELDCLPPKTVSDQFLTCYSIFFIQPSKELPNLVQIPDDNTLQSMSKLERLLAYDKYFSSLQTICQQNIRLGDILDGGWNLCHDTRFRPRKPCLIYSIGIAGDWTFDDESSAIYGCKVFSFDPSIGQKDHQHSERVWFYNIGIGDKDHTDKHNWKIRKLGSIMNMLNHSNSIIDIFKMDIEGNEWPVLKQMLETGALKRIRQLYLEIHAAMHVDRMIIMREFFKHGFKIFWTHQNQNTLQMDLRPLQQGFTSEGFEVYFVNTQFS